MIRRPPRSTRTATLFPYPPALPISGTKALEKLAIDHHRPDLTLLLDINPEEGLRRAQARGDENRFEQETLAFMHKVRDGFLARAKAEPQRIRVVDAAREPDQVSADIIAILADLPHAGA